MIQAVFFDVGETLVSETEHWGQWADVLGIPRLTFFAALGYLIEKNRHHREVFELFGTTRAAAELERQKRGFVPREIQLADFYPDAIPCLRALKKAGFLVGISGNQPERTEAILRNLELPSDFLASSASWGVEKPDLGFFRRIVQLTKLEPNQIVYVGDRLDNDVLPAKALGIKTVFLERGAWGIIHAQRQEAKMADWHIHSLKGLEKLFSR
jgi:HAD superfamily hydrolase (TIGR01549 family)